MNRSNVAAIGITFGIALAYSALCLFLTVMGAADTGTVSMHLFLPHDGSLGYGLDELLPSVPNLYGSFIDLVSGFAGSGSGAKLVKITFVIIGFALAAVGFAMPVSRDVNGPSDHPVRYLWTHRPNGLLKCLAAPWNIIVGAWQFSKPLVIVPVLLLPFYAFWSLWMTVALIVPYVLVRLVFGAMISSAARRERKWYSEHVGSAVCPYCRRRFERPGILYKGMVLDYPVPDACGYKYHEFNNGMKVPCTEGHREGLQTVCPFCGKEITTKDSKPISISLVGAEGSGKTALMLAVAGAVCAEAKKAGMPVTSISPGISPAEAPS